MTCQRKWMYLESIFSATDIQRQLPTEYRLFLSVDKNWKGLYSQNVFYFLWLMLLPDTMRHVKDNPNCITIAGNSTMLENMKRNNANLERVESSLEDYLETKRLAFARLYFLSNDELLEILAHTKRPQSIQSHLRKCFDSMNK